MREKLVFEIADAIKSSDLLAAERYAKDGTVSDRSLGRARAALIAIEAQGYAVVPRDPTEEMLAAGNRQMAYVDCTARAVWNAMRRAAVGDTSDQCAAISASQGEKG